MNGKRLSASSTPVMRSAKSPLPQSPTVARSEEHTSELQSPCNLVCRLLLEKKKKHTPWAVTQYHEREKKTRHRTHDVEKAKSRNIPTVAAPSDISITATLDAAIVTILAVRS